jgi:hypothetical protein
MGKIAYQDDNMVVIHTTEYDNMNDIFIIAGGGIMVQHEGVERNSPVYTGMAVLPVSDDGYEDSYIVFYDVPTYSVVSKDLSDKLDVYWWAYKQEHYEDFYDEDGNPW